MTSTQLHSPSPFKILALLAILGLSTPLLATSKPESIQGSQMPPENNMTLAPCPKSPNCVNSVYFQDKRHYILPLAIRPKEDQSKMDTLLEVINSFDRIKVIKVEGNYLKVEFKSRLFGFVDDVEFLIHDSHTDVRSASRIGYSDFGANRRRVEKIREGLKEFSAEQ